MPKQALVLDWVFADGPPQRANLYDNNHHEDFHDTVAQSISEELYWVEEEHQIYKKLQEERRLREEAIREKVSFTRKFYIHSDQIAILQYAFRSIVQMPEFYLLTMRKAFLAILFQNGTPQNVVR